MDKDKSKNKVIKAYKGFDKDFQCLGMQYEVGKTYEHDGKIKCCDSGYHACENPMDVLNYYNLTTSRFAEVELSGDIDRKKGAEDSKLCASKIAVKAELKLADFIRLSVEWMKKHTRPTKGTNKSSGDAAQMASSGDFAQMASSGYAAQMASSGDAAKMASSGDFAQMASSGDAAKMASSGDFAQMASSGDAAQMASSGDAAQMASSGDAAKMASSGDAAKMASSGDFAQMASSGDAAQMASSGDAAQMASSGDAAKMASSGDAAKMASSGDFAQMASSGDAAQMASSGDAAKMASSGDDCVVMAAGAKSMAKATKGSWITLSEWAYSNEKSRYIPVCVKTEKVDGERIKADTWYKLENGEFKEVKA